MFELEIQKLGPSARGMLYIQLANFPSHYLVLVITDEEFRYALISVDVLSESMYANMVMKDIGWLNIRRIHGDDVVVSPLPEGTTEMKRDANDTSESDSTRYVYQIPLCLPF
jgi:mediator of RNA polymerase II transcription subunit 14